MTVMELYAQRYSRATTNVPIETTHRRVLAMNVLRIYILKLTATIRQSVSDLDGFKERTPAKGALKNNMILPILLPPRGFQARLEQMSAQFDVNSIMIATPLGTRKMAIETTVKNDETESTCSVTSFSYSISSSEFKNVHFLDEVIVYVPVANLLTRDEVQSMWLSRRELASIKRQMRQESLRLRRFNEPYMQAIAHMEEQLARRNRYVKVDVDDFHAAIDSVEEQHRVDKVAARILVHGEERGLERACFSSAIYFSTGARVSHVKEHIMSVLETQSRLQHCGDKRRARFIAASCLSGPSIVWAQIMAEAEAEAVRAH